MFFGSLFYSLQLSTGSFPKPLSEEEEKHYLALSAQGDLDARNILIERNLRLVAHIMKKYYAQTDDQEDLISIGTVGLIKGISSYDAAKGVRLATYAARCVENAMVSQWRRSTWGKNCGKRVNIIEKGLAVCITQTASPFDIAAYILLKTECGFGRSHRPSVWNLPGIIRRLK